MSNNNLNVFLSGEIHTDWREEIIDQSKNQNLSINFFSLKLIMLIVMIVGYLY